MATYMKKFLAAGNIKYKANLFSHSLNHFKRFRISSSAFFQVNTPATELLYAKCAEWCNINKNKKTTLLDLCCGTGTIGITMAKSVDRVIGIEMIPEAIVDAKANALMNSNYYLKLKRDL